MKKPTLKQSYMILGITNDHSFEDARRAYKTKMHRLHPDRFPHDIAAQKKASVRFSQLKVCFKCIEEHYALYGEMPFIDDLPTPSSKQKSPLGSPNNGPSNEEQAQEDERARRDRHEREILSQAASLNTDSSPAPTSDTKTSQRASEKNSSAGEIGAGLFVIGILAYFVLHPPTHKFWIKEEPNTKQQLDEFGQVIRQHKDRHNKDKNSRSAPHDFLLEEQLKSKALLSKTQQRLLETASGRTFTFGSSFKEVAEIHGPPDKSENQTWHYDNSKVMFKDGRVVDWKSDASSPLATRLR